MRFLEWARAVPKHPSVHLALVVFSIAGTSPRALAQRAVPLDEAIETMQALAGRFTTARWQFQMIMGTDTGGNRLGPWPSGQTNSRGDTVYEPGSGRVRAHLKTVVPWFMGPKPYTQIDQNVLFSFDGRRACTYKRERGGTEVPPLVARLGDRVEDGWPGTGSVHGELDEFFKLWAWSCGVRYFPPNFQNQPLPDRLQSEMKKGRRPKISEDHQGVWHVEMYDQQWAGTVIIDYDVRKGGVITGTAWAWRKPGQIGKKLRVDLQQVGGGFWVPKLIDETNLLENPPTVTRQTYSSVKVNEPVSDATFHFDWPANTRIIDYVEKKAYTAGQSVKDEQKLIRDFMTITGLPIHPPAAPRWRWITTCLLAAAVLGIFVTFARRRWLSRATLAAVAAAGMMVGAAKAADPAPSPQPAPEKDANPHITQCGFQVTVFALETWSVEYDVNDLAKRLLPAGFDGIALSKVQRTLADYRLRAKTRQDLTVAGLKQALRDGWIAIIPVESQPSCADYDFSGKPTAWNHYVVAVNHPKEGPVLVDILSSVVPLDKGKLQDAHLKDPNRAVLFIRR